ncbi:MAG: hypothetical protein VYE14_08165 [Verrucomicrobiota bacterium]|nr:hypothetical protein [Verrucomicrobiota bacterium]
MAVLLVAVVVVVVVVAVVAVLRVYGGVREETPQRHDRLRRAPR